LPRWRSPRRGFLAVLSLMTNVGGAVRRGARDRSAQPKTPRRLLEEGALRDFKSTALQKNRGLRPAGRFRVPGPKARGFRIPQPRRKSGGTTPASFAIFAPAKTSSGGKKPRDCFLHGGVDHSCRSKGGNQKPRLPQTPPPSRNSDLTCRTEPARPRPPDGQSPVWEPVCAFAVQGDWTLETFFVMPPRIRRFEAEGKGRAWMRPKPSRTSRESASYFPPRQEILTGNRERRARKAGMKTGFCGRGKA